MKICWMCVNVFSEEFVGRFFNKTNANTDKDDNI